MLDCELSKEPIMWRTVLAIAAGIVLAVIVVYVLKGGGLSLHS